MIGDIYEQDGIKVIHDDSENIGKYLPIARCVDLVVTSPPYFNQRDYENYATLGVYLSKMEIIMQACKRALREWRVIAWNIGQDTKFDLPAQSSILLDNVGFIYVDTICWNKDAEIGTRGVFIEKGLYYPNYTWEPCYIYIKPGIGICSEDNFPSMDDKDIPYFTTHRRSNRWDIPPVRNQVEHPAQFPLVLAEDLIKAYTHTGQTVLEPFGGSGTTAIAARNLGRKCIIFEKMEEYYNLIIKRLKEPQQMSLI